MCLIFCIILKKHNSMILLIILLGSAFMWCFSKLVKCFKKFKAPKNEKKNSALQPSCKPETVLNKKADKSDAVSCPVLPFK